jgi:hypothetical protein
LNNQVDYKSSQLCLYLLHVFRSKGLATITTLRVKSQHIQMREHFFVESVVC